MNYNSFGAKPEITVDIDNKEKPFKLLNDIDYLSSQYSNKNTYLISVEKGYTWNGANIPRFLWRVVGSQYDPQFLPASMIHDWLCEHKNFITKKGVKISSDIFKDILILSGVSKPKAWVMASAVRSYQYTQKGWN